MDGFKRTCVIGFLFVTGVVLGDHASVESPGEGYRRVEYADFDSNGVAESVWTNDRTGNVVVVFRKYNGFERELIGSVASDTRWKLAAVGDLNGDRSPDLLWVLRVGNDIEVSAWWYRGLHRLGEGIQYYKGPLDSRYRLVGLDDVDDDTVTDIVWQHPVDGFSAWVKLAKRPDAFPRYQAIGLP